MLFFHILVRLDERSLSRVDYKLMPNKGQRFGGPCQLYLFILDIDFDALQLILFYIRLTIYYWTYPPTLI